MNIFNNKKKYAVKDFKFGFISINGTPNVGKSTLLNCLLGRKISITSTKPQTTRNKINGILSNSSYQLVFIDTPGLHNISNVFNNRMVDTSFTTAADADLILFVTDVSNHNLETEKLLLNKFKKSNKPIILVMNKIDKIKKTKILSMISSWSNIYNFANIIPVCAKNKKEATILINSIKNILPKGKPLFPLNSITNLSKKFVIAEIIREKIFRSTGQEIPYSVAVTVDNLETKPPNPIIHIHSTIHLERDSQKKVILGTKGKKIKNIAKTSRLEIQKLLSSKVYLNIFVRVQKNWSKDTKALERFGY